MNKDLFYTTDIHARRLRAMLRKAAREELPLQNLCPAHYRFSPFSKKLSMWAELPCATCKRFVGLDLNRSGYSCPCTVLGSLEATARSWEAIELYFTKNQQWKPPASIEDREQVTITRHIVVPAPITGIGWYAVKEWNPALREYQHVSTHRSEELAEEAIARYERRK